MSSFTRADYKKIFSFASHVYKLGVPFERHAIEIMDMVEDCIGQQPLRPAESRLPRNSPIGRQIANRHSLRVGMKIRHHSQDQVWEIAAIKSSGTCRSSSPIHLRGPHTTKVVQAQTVVQYYLEVEP